MSHYAESYRLTRVLFLGTGLLVAALLLWISLNQPTPSLHQVSGMVLEVNIGQGQGLRSGSSVQLATARIRLEDGRETRVLLQSPLPEIGQKLILIEARYADGERRYRLDPQANLP